MVITKMKNKKGAIGIIFLVVSLLIVSSSLIITINKIQKTDGDNNIAETGFLLLDNAETSLDFESLDGNEEDDNFGGSFSGGGGSGGSSGGRGSNKKKKKVDDSNALTKDINFDEDEEFVEVIVILKDDEIPTITEDSLPEIKAEVNAKQDEVLSNLNPDEFHLKHKYNTISGFAGKITREGLDKLEQDPNVEAIYEDKMLHITLAESVPLINATEVWELEDNFGEKITGKGSVVCILDTGIDYTHPDLGDPSCNITINGNIISLDPSVESPHPYERYSDQTWTIINPGFENIAVHFSKIDLGVWGKITIRDVTGKAVQSFISEYREDFWSLSVPGDTIKIQLSTTYNEGWGFTIDKVLNGISNYWDNCGRILDGYDFAYNDNDPMDEHGHGTHVAGIVAANGTIKGVAPDVELLIGKVCYDFGGCWWSDITKGIDWCNIKKSTYNIVATTMSIGDHEEYNSTTCPPEIGIIDVANDLGIAVTVASGNEYYSDGISFPACLQNTISVGSTTKSDVISDFTNTGDNLDLLAPGYFITSTKLGGGSIIMSGTSMAAPHVAGAIALLKQFSPLALLDQIKNALKNTGIPITDPGNNLSFSRIDVLAALGYNECSLDLDCGTNGYVGDLFCQDDDIWQNYTTYSCNNPGEIAAYCSNSTSPRLKGDCEYGCDGAECMYPDLVVENLYFSEIEGTKVWLIFTIKNIGNAIADSIYWMVDTNSSDENQIRNSTNLAPGNTILGGFSWTYAESGNYNPTVIVDFDNLINESNESNNEMNISVSV